MMIPCNNTLGTDAVPPCFSLLIQPPLPKIARPGDRSRLAQQVIEQSRWFASPAARRGPGTMYMDVVVQNAQHRAGEKGPWT